MLAVTFFWLAWYWRCFFSDRLRASFVHTFDEKTKRLQQMGNRLLLTYLLGTFSALLCTRRLAAETQISLSDETRARTRTQNFPFLVHDYKEIKATTNWQLSLTSSDSGPYRYNTQSWCTLCRWMHFGSQRTHWSGGGVATKMKSCIHM